MPAEHLHAVPHLTTALTGPLQQIETLLLTEQSRIETWLRAEWRKTPALYTSVDLRNAGFKLAPVDTNLFPAGFNNLNAALLASVQKKYDEYGIDKPPFVVIKADAGTYGLGIISVSSIEEVQSLNRKQRTKMAAMKGGTSVSKVILQEGVYTFDTWGDQNADAEPNRYYAYGVLARLALLAAARELAELNAAKVNQSL